MPVTRPVLRWHGGKYLLAERIMAYFPPHRTYTETFGGAASVLLQKPRAHAEIYNDLDDQVVGLFRVLQDLAQSGRLMELLRLTPFARREFQIAYEVTDDPIEAARRLVIRSFMGFGSNAHSCAGRGHRSTGFRSNSSRSGTTPARDWANYPDALPALIERLQGVVIENRDAPTIMRRHDKPTTLHYCLPPGELVRTADERFLPIETVAVGEVLFGGRRVTERMSRVHRGEMLALAIQSLPDPLRLTPEHQVVYIPGRHPGQRQEKRSKEALWRSRKEASARDLRPGDYLLVPLGGASIDPNLQMQDLARTRGRRRSDARLLIGPELYRLIGYYAAEGHVHRPTGSPDARGTSVILSFGAHEESTWVADAARCAELALGPKPIVKRGPHDSVRQVHINSTTAAEFIEQLVIGTATEKRLSPALMCASPGLQREVLIGWLRGDGGLAKESRNRFKLLGTSSSEQLARQMFTMALRCGLRPSFKRRRSISTIRGKRYDRPAFDVYFASSDARSLGWEIAGTRSDCSTRRVVEGHLLLRVRGIKTEAYDGPVFDLNVDSDDLFAAPYALVHNCDPPYLQETRRREHMYRHELTRADHLKLLAGLRKLSGMVVLSGYASDLYDKRLRDWERIELPAYADGARPRTEVLWLNPACVAALKLERAGRGTPLFPHIEMAEAAE